MDSTVAMTIMPILEKERELDAPRLQAKIVEYLWKASKHVCAKPPMPWDAHVKAFVEKFYEVFWNAMYEREWIDDVDFAISIASAIKAYTPSPHNVALQGVSNEQFVEKVVSEADAASDSCRYNMNVWTVVKKYFESSKKMKNEVCTALEKGRELTFETGQAGNALSFMSIWVRYTINQLAQSRQGQPSKVLEEPQAVQMFAELVMQGGVPAKFMKAGGFIKTNPEKIELMMTQLKIVVDATYQTESTKKEWICPTCGVHNFAHLQQCYKCNLPKNIAEQQKASEFDPVAYFMSKVMNGCSQVVSL